ncbi:DUF2179 domain-containing protein [Mycoplasmopsis caviae]|uniref:DUF2179 domain-containing protein n=1 Tax=Mycoplasmopsis caviae TaxID=55603 RepID=A0A3P8KMY1_9BACT|nr:DUF2179 domain-containing protein [Mycoplasmopsis caviae]UUD34978.1 DUF2179 domain-containing protein [Mycoplasmopsis caviae]VDR42198.1 Uncharacterized protein conserved in bacteria (DUF2179) [Mycoplasmopsis caviae]
MNNANNEQNKNDKRVEVEIKRSKVRQSFLHFGTLYRVKKLRVQVILSVLIGLIFGIGQFLLVQITGLYNLGLDAFCQSVARIAKHFIINDKIANIVYNSLFWIINLLANIPLFILGYKKINKRFGFLTIIFMSTATIFGLIIGYIPGSDGWFIFTHIKAEELTWEKAQFSDLTIFVYAMVWAFLQAGIAAALLIISSSTGGSDVLGVYWSHKTFKDVGGTFIFVHLAFLTVANLIGTYIPLITKPTGGFKVDAFKPEYFFNPSFVAGIIMVLINGVVLNVLFPKYKIVKAEIYSSKIPQIQDKINTLTNVRFATSHLSVKGGYSGQEQEVLLTMCLYLDAALLLEIVREFDQNALFTVTDLKKADGYFYVSVENYKSLFTKTLERRERKNKDNKQEQSDTNINQSSLD